MICSLLDHFSWHSTAGTPYCRYSSLQWASTFNGNFGVTWWS
ncbi:unnamed protein product [Acanthoscelides obtectus]|uniref:Uncharacterized protein n=1 Tax=Acanthoscelides obtectus TaxID=200917 RepID=A0A9P0KHE1_ACAOB|nr:unnamed protein product [Acanthoscelides obtectus]CAK1662942.1 hypothetical protein AOBTE_LOCUS23387 [Acanthoscelides obtectus]